LIISWDNLRIPPEILGIYLLNNSSLARRPKMAGQSKDKWAGRGKKVKGKLKEEAGKLTGNKDAEAEGVADQIEGKVQEAWGKIKEKVEDIKDKVR
jgi:uncharacterized protein YjbJ (UPF0337 family)